MIVMKSQCAEFQIPIGLGNTGQRVYSLMYYKLLNPDDYHYHYYYNYYYYLWVEDQSGLNSNPVIIQLIITYLYFRPSHFSWLGIFHTGMLY